MDLGILFKKAGRVAAENSPAILAALGVSGTLTTAWLSAKGAFQASKDIDEASAEKYKRFQEAKLNQDEAEAESLNGGALTTQEKAELTWKRYIPAAASAALTVSAIILAVRVQERRNAALAAAYTTVEKSYAEYRAKNVEKIGKNKEQALRDEIAQDRMNANPPEKVGLILNDRNATTTVEDAWSGRFYTSSRVAVDKAVNEFNAKLNRDGYGSLTDFWDFLRLDSTTDSDYIGWNRDKGLLEISWSAVINPKTDEAAMSYSFTTLPDPRFSSAY